MSNAKRSHTDDNDVIFVEDSTWSFEIDDDESLEIEGKNSKHQQISRPENDPRIIYMTGHLSNWTAADVTHIVQEEVNKALNNPQTHSCCDHH